MEFTLVAGTLGERPDQLARLVDSVQAQDVEGVQLVVVDQSPEGIDPPEIPADHVDLVHLREVPGLSRARNAGMELARGDVLGFPDDDCWYPEGTLARVAGLLERRGLDLVTGRYGDPETGASPFPRETVELSPRNMWGRASSVSLFVRRRFTERAGLRFDPELGVGTPLPAAEEFDFLGRALLAGAAGEYHPDLVVHHPVEQSTTPSQAARDEDESRRRLAGCYVRARHALSPAWGLLAQEAASATRDLLAAPLSAEARDRLDLKLRAYREALTDRAPPSR